MSTVFVDVDTQIDFLFPTGALYVPGSERLLPTISGLNALARSRGIPVISTMDAHSEDDPEFRQFPPHCVVDTAGQRKPAATLLDAGQHFIPKQTFDCFTNASLRPLLDSLGATHCVVYGVVTEICVRYAVLGLLDTGRSVSIVTDAIKELSAPAAQEFLAAAISRGATLTTAAAVHG